MSRPMLLVFLLIVLIITSQVEWKQPLVVDQDDTPSAAEKQLRVAERQESVKEKIILSQEKSIHDLRNAVRDLQNQLKQCQSSQESLNGSSHIIDNNVIGIERAASHTTKPVPSQAHHL